MRPRRRRWAAAALAAHAAATPLHADPLKLEPGKDTAIICDTRSVVVADEAAATKGSAQFKLSVPAGDKADSGTWTVAEVEEAHKGSLAQRQKEICAKGCPFDTSPKNELQLWAPAAITLDKLGEKDVLTIAVIKPDTLVLRASTFRGPDIESLEEGQCRLAPQTP